MKKILIIDDEEDFCTFVKNNIELTRRYKVVVEMTGEGALDAALRERPDLILLDILMPSISGFEVLKRLKEREATKRIPIIVLTAVEYSQAKERAKDFSVEGYIVKPTRAADLLAKIDDVFRKTGTIRGQDEEDTDNR
jgi:two-component system alkaline phosphatase synthesis response regulator PhoP